MASSDDTKYLTGGAGFLPYDTAQERDDVGEVSRYFEECCQDYSWLRDIKYPFTILFRCFSDKKYLSGDIFYLKRHQISQ